MPFIARTIDNLMAMLLQLLIGSYIIYKDSFYCQSIVSAIRVIYTKSGEFYYRYLHRFSIISLMIGISELSFVTACSNSYTKSILITYKSSYKQILYFGLPSMIRSASQMEIAR